MGGEVLSQSEIDDLLKGFSSGEVKAEQLKAEQDKKRVQVYDFKRALRFSKEQIRSLSRIHENFGRMLGTSLSGTLRTYTQVSVDHLDQLPYKEFIGSISTKTILVKYEVPPLEGRILLEISPTIAFAIMDRLLGGYGEEFEPVIRESLTVIEERILSQVFEGIGENLKGSWENMTYIEPIIEEVEVNPQFVQMVSPNETVVIVPLNVTIGETQGMMNLCIPHVVLESVLPKLSIQHQMQTTKKDIDEETLTNITRSVRGSHLPVKAILGETTIKIADFKNLGIGDAIRLNQNVNDPLIIKVGEEHKFNGNVGVSNKRFAIRIQDTLKEGDE
ncbi:flagellar motor switch protein FliM (plasmid) [Rossellomorea sp. AcN35-11]|nr:flagellar motor switch protein FliM [Rossellomorea aquimaris]WJV32288.1 flagellar motor switch protein FliM [Rossellomorea sp. AcN35-11]